MQNGVGVLEHAADNVAAVLDPLVRCGPARDCHCSVATGRRPKGFRYICGMNRADMMWHVCVGMLVMMQEMSKLSKVGHILDRGMCDGSELDVRRTQHVPRTVLERDRQKSA
jgi:hypothetical protein